MSRYFFDLHNGDGPTVDEEGQELSSRTSVALEVARILGDIARDEMPDRQNGTIALTVRDETGRTVARNDERARAVVEELVQQGLNADSVRIDLDDLSTVASAADEIQLCHGRLDILVNNAGIFDFVDAAPSKASIDAVRRVMEINFIGALALTQAVLPLLRKAPAARIVNVSSSLGSLALNGDPSSTYYSQRYIGYNASKAALNMLTIQLNEELKGTGIVVNSISPGFVKTDLTGYGDLTPEEGARLPVRHALEGAASGSFIEPDGTTPW